MQPAETTFWNWFEDFTGEFSFDKEGYLIYTDEMEINLEKAIEKYDDGLGCIIGSENYIVELIITAYGNSEKFKSVNDLVHAAPELTNIRVIALKPPAEDPSFITTYKQEKVNSEDVYFDVFENSEYPKRIGIKVFFEKEKMDNAIFEEIAVIMCESIVGERNYSDYVELIGVESLDRKNLKQYISLVSLKDYLDWHIKNIKT